MKKFIVKLCLVSFVSILLLTIFLNVFGSYVDFYYTKFTSPKQHSFIIGDSKSFMGIRPDIIDQNIKDFEHPMFNYSFTMSQTAYGDCYLSSIKRKLDSTTKDGLFILSINPFVLSERENDTIQKGIFFEANLPPHNMYFQSMNPNPEYIIKNFNEFHFKAFFRKISRLHDNGWQEVINLPNDSSTCKDLTKKNIQKFADFSKRWKKSNYRLSKLEETIVFLKKHGRVVLLRMPSHKKIEAIDDAFWNNFDMDITNLANKTDVKYINFKSTANQFRLFDGIHFDLKSTALFTKTLCDSINLDKDKFSK